MSRREEYREAKRNLNEMLRERASIEREHANHLKALKREYEANVRTDTRACNERLREVDKEIRVRQRVVDKLEQAG